MKTILVPTDLSSNANNALAFADSIAKSQKAKIVLLYVYVPTIGKYNSISGLIAEEIVTAKKQALRKMEKIAEKYISGKYSIAIEVHDPVDTILAEAKKIKADLIVMGTHGATGLKKLLFGSNTAKVIAHAKTPVLAVPQRYRAQKIKKVICTSDLNSLAKEIKAISSVTKALKAKTEVVYMQYVKDQQISTADKFKAVAKKEKLKNITFTEKKVSESVKLTDAIKNYVNKNKASIFAIFPEEKSIAEKWIFGSKTEQLAYGLKIPMLSIRKSQL